MKNLMIFFSPTHSFNNPRPDVINDATTLVKVQIDNSFSLGWKKEDILLFTNFDYQYEAVKAIVIKDSEFSRQDIEFIKQKPRFSRFVVIKKLFEKGLINASKGKKREHIYWSHDFDAFQLQPIEESELGLGKSDIGSVDSFADSPRENTSWNTSSFFFKPSSKDIFVRALELMYRENITEEAALNQLTLNDESIKKRIKKLNLTYDLKRFHFVERYEKAIKPIKVVHFHPYYWGGFRILDKFMGKNSLGVSLITERLSKIFKFHGIS